MKKLYEDIFMDISWSTDRVYNQTIDKITRQGLEVYELPELIDIDTEEDLRLWLYNDSAKKDTELQKLGRQLVA